MTILLGDFKLPDYGYNHYGTADIMCAVLIILSRLNDASLA
jgi:hypothetical protein